MLQSIDVPSATDNSSTISGSMDSFIKGVPAVAGIVNGEREALVEIIVKVTNSSFIKLSDAQITATFFRIGFDNKNKNLY